MAFGELLFLGAGNAVDAAAALDGRAFGNLLGPAHQIGVAFRVEEFRGAFLDLAED
jgi:hypothetical protein